MQLYSIIPLGYIKKVEGLCHDKSHKNFRKADTNYHKNLSPKWSYVHVKIGPSQYLMLSWAVGLEPLDLVVLSLVTVQF